jgi:hypothetical protein
MADQNTSKVVRSVPNIEEMASKFDDVGINVDASTHEVAVAQTGVGCLAISR